MLNAKDKVFQNLHGFQEPFIEGALQRGSWSNTKEILSKNQNDIIEFANHAAGVVVSKLGTATASLKEIQEYAQQLLD